ncbi:MAG: orotidine-5'-phosphate decarboxylase [Methanocalculus sp. MSAO_Arc1]|uniref:orotidine-5'-phosphate decarboxylase n=1 Tax=Methanocalculus TaxID=71151 RepID=UPI000FF57AC6|nr:MULTISPECIES: orotidine-5'-phosphate decarboxylase [unclassified Methanocalculus]MCP1661570.1 orotidine-5'-phosphate decarboxylase [Methanocalculus sp. AMF5]RQD82035.1 MAG: orotidine-5'-phosphate decarboxylase [Methanocalculus sp. MSAO_Arc1]
MTDLILALDATSRDEALAIAESTARHLDAVKIGYPLVLAAGLSIASEIAALGVPVIADFKVADIPNTNTLICDQVFAAGCSAVICHAFPGRDSLEASVASAHAHGGECFVVCEMSHPGGAAWFSGGVAEAFCSMAVAAGADGIIAPATRPDRVAALRELVGRKKIYSPGVGAQGASPEDVRDLVDGVIVGRAIYGAADPGSAAAAYARRCR